MLQRSAFLLAAGLGFGLLAGIALAQPFPPQPVRIISPFPAGSGPDVVARIVGERLTASWKQSIVVDARPGANGFLAASAVKQAAPTGYDLLIADVGHLSIARHCSKSCPMTRKPTLCLWGAFIARHFSLWSAPIVPFIRSRTWSPLPPRRAK